MKSLIIFPFICLISCLNSINETNNDSKYSKYCFNILDSNYNSKSFVEIELFGKLTKCDNYKDTFRISKQFLDSIPENSFENNLEFISRPRLLMSNGELKNLMVVGLMKDNYFKLSLSTESSDGIDTYLSKDSSFIRTTIQKIDTTVNKIHNFFGSDD